ncbi:hypothetical protein LCGC14_0887630 [marine sediment metagenome]|uniref:C1q domain-containing protein n=1 Tax=marine sediment metagenome TaxID=412755 RepID=A0A0F9P511_9ZZZZ
MTLTPEQLELRIQSLEARNAKLERLVKPNRSFVDNPLSLATDLDSLGSVKTFLEFEETVIDPKTLQDTGRMFAATRSGDPVIRYVSAGDPSEISHPPVCRVYNDASITIAASTEVALTYNTERYDKDGMHSTSSNQSRITAQVPGKYLFIAHTRWAGFTASKVYTFIMVGGSTEYARDERGMPVGADINVTVSTLIDMAVGNYAEVFVFHDNASPQSSVADVANGLEFSAVWVSP